MNNSTSIKLFIALFLLSLNMRPAVTSIGPLIDTIRNDLSLSNSEISLLTAIPVICMGLFAPLAVFWLKRFGQKWGMSLLVIIIGIMTAARYIFSDYIALLITALFIGIAIAMMGPILSAFIKERFPTQTPLAITIYSLGLGGGATVSAGLTGYFFVGFNNNWPASLAIWSILAVISVVFWKIVYHPHVEEEKNEEQTIATIRSPLKNKRAWFILLFFGLQSALFFSLTTWLGSIAGEHGLSVLASGTLISVMTITQLIVNLFVPMMLAKNPSRVFWIFVALGFATIGLVLLFIGLLWVAAVVLGTALAILFPVGLILPLDETNNAQEANEWSAMILSGGFIIGGIFPFVIGVVYDATGTHNWIIVLMLTLIIGMAIFTYLLKNKQKSESI